jgi:GTPase SAR1 family protein
MTGDFQTMYKEIRELKPIKKDAIKIWRYLDFTKFVSLLDTNALFFARADTMEDPLEGSLSKANIEARQKDDAKLPKKALIQLAELHKNARSHIFINSWHMNDVESAAMWKLFLQSSEGIAIQSTVSNLKKSFEVSKDYEVNIAKVEYIDYETHVIPEKNILYPFIHKRKSFEHEKELRALTLIMPGKTEDDSIDFSIRNPNLGIYVDVDIDVLIDRVYVAPTALPWFHDLTKSVMETYGVEKEVIKSNLAVDPVY